MRMESGLNIIMKFSKIISDKITMKDSLEIKVRRGEKSLSKLWSVFFFLSALATAFISILEISALYKAIAIAFSVISLFYLCLYNSWFRNKTIGVFNKVANKEEKFSK